MMGGKEVTAIAEEESRSMDIVSSGAGANSHGGPAKYRAKLCRIDTDEAFYGYFITLGFFDNGRVAETMFCVT